MKKVVKLKVVKSRPDKEVVEFCRTILNEARSGELRSIAVVTVKSGGIVGTGWQQCQSPRGDYHELCSGALSLVTRLGRKD